MEARHAEIVEGVVREFFVTALNIAQVAAITPGSGESLTACRPGQSAFDYLRRTYEISEVGPFRDARDNAVISHDLPTALIREYTKNLATGKEPDADLIDHIDTIAVTADKSEIVEDAECQVAAWGPLVNQLPFDTELRAVYHTALALIDFVWDVEMCAAAPAIYANALSMTGSGFSGQGRDFPNCLKLALRDDARSTITHGLSHALAHALTHINEHTDQSLFYN